LKRMRRELAVPTVLATFSATVKETPVQKSDTHDEL